MESIGRSNRNRIEGKRSIQTDPLCSISTRSHSSPGLDTTIALTAAHYTPTIPIKSIIPPPAHTIEALHFGMFENF